MTSTQEERSPQDEATIDVMGSEIISLTNSKLNLQVELAMTQKELIRLGENCQRLTNDNEKLEERNLDLARQHNSDEESIRLGGEQNRRLMADNDLLRQRIAELSRPAYQPEMVDEDPDEKPYYKDPEDGPLIDSV